MAIEPNLESAVTAQRVNLVDNISNSAQGSQAKVTKTAVTNLSDRIISPDDDEDRRSTLPPGRGRNFDISI